MGPLGCGRVHGKEDDEESDQGGNEHHRVGEEFYGPKVPVGFLDVGGEAAHVKYGVGLQTALQLGRDLGDVGWLVARDQHQGGLPGRAHQLLHGSDGNEDSGSLPVLDDAGNVKGVIHQLDLVPQPEFPSLGVNIVDNDIVGPLKAPAFQVDEALGDPVEALQVNAPDESQPTAGVQLEIYGGHRLYFFDPGNQVGDLDRHGAGAGRQHQGGIGRLQDDVGAHAGDAFAVFPEHAAGQADQQQDQRHLHPDRQGRGQRPHRAGTDVGHNKLSAQSEDPLSSLLPAESRGSSQ